ncbi:MucBP domain-containing protein, partial [Limosilactobacillus equigenerosi]|uniref:MucBP domain-containing protein n=1 Tax=Limosilactobacillus equigenerosi TaxID=417373 RepID=UPI0012E3318F
MMNITESAHADVTSTVNTTEATMVPVNNQGNNQDSSDKSNSSQTVSVADLVDKGTNDSSQVTPKMLLASKLATDNQSTTATNGLSYGSQGSVNPSFPQGYPANYWKDPVQNRYSFEVLGLTTDGTIKGSKYYAVLSTNNNGDGSLYVTFINRSTNKPIVNTRQVSEKAEWIDNRTFGLSANKNWWIKKLDNGFDAYSGGDLGEPNKLNRLWQEYSVFQDPNNSTYKEIEQLIPVQTTQTTSYVDQNGKQIADPVVLHGVSGQTYTIAGPKQIDGYKLVESPEKTTGRFSDFSKGFKFSRTQALGHVVLNYEQIDNNGTMRVQIFFNGQPFNGNLIYPNGNEVPYNGSVIVPPVKGGSGDTVNSFSNFPHISVEFSDNGSDYTNQTAIINYYDDSDTNVSYVYEPIVNDTTQATKQTVHYEGA